MSNNESAKSCELNNGHEDETLETAHSKQGNNKNEQVNDHANDEEKQNALTKLRRPGQTYDEDEDFETFDNELFNRAGEKYVYFWRGHDIYSQWYKSKFYVDGMEFGCAEQFMMYKKAELFQDYYIANKILYCNDPRKIKALGRQVLGFVDDIWQYHCLYIVKEGNTAKFSQNEGFLKEIFRTYPKVLVEASPYDRIWGIGLEEYDPLAWDESTWQGKNYLGYILTEVRDDLMFERGLITEGDRKKYIDQLLEDSGLYFDTDMMQDSTRYRKAHQLASSYQSKEVARDDFSEVKGNVEVKQDDKEQKPGKYTSEAHGSETCKGVAGTKNEGVKRNINKKAEKNQAKSEIGRIKGATVANTASGGTSPSLSTELANNQQSPTKKQKKKKKNKKEKSTGAEKSSADLGYIIDKGQSDAKQDTIGKKHDKSPIKTNTSKESNDSSEGEAKSDNEAAESKISMSRRQRKNLNKKTNKNT